MTKLSEITQPNWSFSLEKPGEVVQGVEEISQCIIIIVKTIKGSDPLRPEFGTDLFLYIDKPINEALPKMIKAIADAVEKWETRVDIVKIDYAVELGFVNFGITWKEKITGIGTTTNIVVNGSN